MADEGFVSGRMSGIGSKPAQQSPAHIPYKPRTDHGRSAVEGKTLTPDWIRQPKNPEALIIARDSFERPIELQDGVYMEKTGLILSRKYQVGETLELKRPFSLYPFTLKWEAQKDTDKQTPVVAQLREQLIDVAIIGDRYEALHNDKDFLKQICHALVKDAVDETQGGKYYSRSRFPRVPSQTKVCVVNHKNQSDTFTSCGGFNVYVVEVVEGPATGLRFIAYASDLAEISMEGGGEQNSQESTGNQA